MKISILSAAAALALVESVSAHYIFQQLSVGGTKYGVYENIRKNSNYNSPVVDLASNDLRCNEGATGAGTSTVNVKAGDSVTFTLDTAVYHQGPVSVYMSKAPGKASEYDGSGGWFKIKDWGPTFSGGNANWPMSISYTFNLPTCIANGEYLLRMQQLGIHNPYPAALPQFYISCAQINVSGGGGQNPSSTVKIPGAFKETDPGYTANIYNNFSSYQIPGPSVFTCSGNSNPQPDPEPQPQPQPSTTLRTTTTSAGNSQPTNGGNCSPLYGQCGGKDWTGAKCCSAGNCKVTNEYYSQCTN